MRLSFRSRIFLTAIVLVLVVMAIVLFFGWTTANSIEMQRLEERLCVEAKRLALFPSAGAGDVEHLSAELIRNLQSRTPEDLLYKLSTDNDAFSVQSEQWPEDFNFSNLSWSQLALPKTAGDSAAEIKSWSPLNQVCLVASFSANDRHWRAASFTTRSARSFIASDTGTTRRLLFEVLSGILLKVVPLALVLALAAAWLLSGITMQPLNRLREAMKTLTQKDLSHRLSAEGEDTEFKELIEAYNEMLGRLENSIAQASRFSADASHELKTPLTILQGRIEQALNRAEYRSIQGDLTDMMFEVGRLSAITRKLLILSQAAAGRLALHKAQIDLSALLNDLMDDAEMLLSSQTLNHHIAPGLTTYGDETLLRQLFNNLLSNAVRYCRVHGWIDVQVSAQPGGVEIIFANACLPISEQDRSCFFDRFFRAESARERGIEGHGLGLSLALEIVNAHHGQLSLLPSALDEVRLRLWLPAQ